MLGPTLDQDVLLKVLCLLDPEFLWLSTRRVCKSWKLLSEQAFLLVAPQQVTTSIDIEFYGIVVSDRAMYMLRKKQLTLQWSSTDAGTAVFSATRVKDMKTDRDDVDVVLSCDLWAGVDSLGALGRLHPEKCLTVTPVAGMHQWWEGPRGIKLEYSWRECKEPMIRTSDDETEPLSEEKWMRLTFHSLAVPLQVLTSWNGVRGDSFRVKREESTTFMPWEAAAVRKHQVQMERARLTAEADREEDLDDGMYESSEESSVGDGASSEEGSVDDSEAVSGADSDEDS